MMDKQEWSKEQQVWQRVQASREEPPKNDLRQLQREAMELAAIYRSLASRLSGKQQEYANILYKGERANGAALAGIGVLSHEAGENLKLWQPGKEDTQRTLQRCYHRTRRCMTEYMARSAEMEFGIVFEKLARREAEHCLILAQLLGSGKQG